MAHRSHYLQNKVVFRMDVFEIKKLFAAQGTPDSPLVMTTDRAQKLYQRLEMEPPDVQFYQEAITLGPEDQALIQLHAHPFYELIYCREAMGMEYLIGHSIYKPEQGDLIFIPAGVSHRLLLPEHPPSSYSWDVLWLSRNFMDGIRPLLTQDGFDFLHNGPVFRVRNGNSTEIGDIYRYGIGEAANHVPGWVSAPWREAPCCC